MNLVWTYNHNAVVGKVTDERRITLINYYILSITTAKKLGHHTIIYTTTNSVEYFVGIADEIIELNDYHNSLQWDSFKVYVLEDRTDDYYMIDGDFILNKKLPNIDSEIIFDTYEIGNWKYEYESTINKFTELGIKSIVPEWSDTFTPIINTSILSIKSKEFSDLYVKRWKEMDNWITNMIENHSINMDTASLVGGQYLLTVMANYYSIKKYNFNNYMGEHGEYYTHYFGNIKFLNPLVPNDYIITINTKKTIL